MKNKILIAGLLLLTVSFAGQAQGNRIANMNEKITFLGLDFTKARFIGDYLHFENASEVGTFTKSINELMDRERAKFDIAKMLHRPSVEYNIKVAEEHNASLDIPGLLADSTGQHKHLEESDMNGIVQGYNFGDNSGIGLLFVVETFNKKIPEALLWIVFVDMGSKEIISAKPIAEAPKGFGLRNYWAGAVYAMMTDVRKTHMKGWYGVK